MKNHYRITFEVFGLAFTQQFFVRATSPENAQKRFTQDCKGKVILVEEVTPVWGVSFADGE